MPKNLGTTFEAARSSSPIGVTAGQTYYNIANKIPYFFDGTVWKSQIGVLQTVQNAITIDTTTTSNSFTNLITQSITTGANFLIVNFFACCSNTAGSGVNYFRIRVDGTTARSGGVRSPGSSPGGITLSAKVAVTASTHSVTVDWYRSNGTAQIRPVSEPDAESASLLIWEVTN